MKILRKVKYYVIHFIFLIFGFGITTFGLFAQWEPDVRLTFNTGTSSTSFPNARCIATSGDTVHIVWQDDRSGSDRIYYKRSTDAGISWGTDIQLTNTSAGSEVPSLAVSGAVIHVVWQDFRGGTNYKIYYKRSTDAGTSWGTDIQLTFTSTFSLNPSVTVSGQVVHVVWQDRRDGPNYEIYYKRSTDAGISWGTDLRLTNDPAYSWSPSISVSGQVVHVVWYDARDGPNFEIYYKRSTDGGSTWETDTRLTNDPNGSAFPNLSLSGQVIHLVWYDNRNGAYEVYYKRSTDQGITWGPDIRLTNDPAASLGPTISVSGSIAHVVWADERNGTQNFEIYYKKSTDGGLNWGSDIRLTNDPAYARGAYVSVSGQVVHIIWSELRDGNYEIYYKRDPTGNVVGVTNINTEISNKFSLSQNYPNPFNPKTKIEFAIPNAGFTQLKIYDALGREIATLVNEELKRGTYEVDWDASNFPSGVYFYKLIAGDYSETKKMMLIK